MVNRVFLLQAGTGAGHSSHAPRLTCPLPGGEEKFRLSVKKLTKEKDRKEEGKKEKKK